MRFVYAALAVLLFWCLMYYIGIEMERPDLSSRRVYDNHCYCGCR